MVLVQIVKGNFVKKEKDEDCIRVISVMVIEEDNQDVETNYANRLVVMVLFVDYESMEKIVGTESTAQKRYEIRRVLIIIIN